MRTWCEVRNFASQKFRLVSLDFLDLDWISYPFQPNPVTDYDNNNNNSCIYKVPKSDMSL